MLSESIKKLVQYGIETGLTPACEKNYTTNLLLDVFKEDEYTEPAEEYSDINLEEVLKELLDEAVERGLIQDSVVYSPARLRYRSLSGKNMRNLRKKQQIISIN